MSALKKLFFMPLGVIFFVGFVACQEEGPAEKAGKEIDEAVEQLGEKAEEAGDKVQDATQQ